LKRLIPCIMLIAVLLTSPIPSALAAQPHASAAPRNPWGYTFTHGRLIKSPPPKFCNYFKCIKNFPKGRGYVVECKDAMYSKSGGIRGLCSGHRGYSRTLYAH